MRVIVAAVLYFFLGLFFAGTLTFDTYSVNVFTQSFGFLAAAWLTVAGIAIGTMVFGLWLGRHTRVARHTDSAEPLSPQ